MKAPSLFTLRTEKQTFARMQALSRVPRSSILASTFFMNLCLIFIFICLIFMRASRVCIEGTSLTCWVNVFVQYDKTFLRTHKNQHPTYKQEQRTLSLFVIRLYVHTDLCVYSPTVVKTLALVVLCGAGI